MPPVPPRFIVRCCRNSRNNPTRSTCSASSRNRRGNSELAAESSSRRRWRKSPISRTAWHNRCLVLRALHRPDEALQSRRAKPSRSTLRSPMRGTLAGSILREKRQFDEAACQCLERAVALRPGSPSILNSYIVLLTACGRLKDAWQAAQKMMAQRMDDVSGTTGIGNLLKAAGHPARAIAVADPGRRSTSSRISRAPSLNEAMALLQMGDNERGLAALWNGGSKDAERKPMPYRHWKGEYVEHLLLLEDQGLGDALQCMRYIPLHQGPRRTKSRCSITALLERTF